MGKREQILQQLASNGGFVSGQELCEMLGVSRTAVWKNIQKLKEEGYLIEAVTNKGYRLLSVQEADVFNREQIESELKTAWAGHPVIYMDETGSTNEDIFALAAQGYPHGTLAVTTLQTAGKGRRGRTWISPQEGNIYMSILIKPDLRPDLTPMLTIVMALSVYQAALDLLSGIGPRSAICRFGIKWPNDIVVSPDGGPFLKLCGILTEMRMEDSEISAITIGTGLNVNQTIFPPEIAQNATSFALALGRKVNRASLTASIWNHFEKNYGIFMQTRDFSRLRPAYERGLVNLGRPVRVLDPQKPFTGIAMGINDYGALLVRPDEGTGNGGNAVAGSLDKGFSNNSLFSDKKGERILQDSGSGDSSSRLIAVSSGEVSVRGVNGYV